MHPDWLWENAGTAARGVRIALTPASWGYRAAVAARNVLFDLGVLRTRATSVPALSVGNLSVGGTGKTPVAADVARRLRLAGAAPALVLRGYGDDEPRVHALLNPEVPVLTSADRVAASAAARARGCDVVVLDDAFQHRWARRVVDVVLVAAEQWPVRGRSLPIGPYREPLAALGRATLVLVTRKASTAGASEEVARALGAVTTAPIGRVAFALDALRRVGGAGEPPVPGAAGGAADHAGAERPLASLRGTSVLAVTGIGAPRAFARQLEEAGATVELVSFPDHHAFTAADVAALLRRAPRHACVVCTLKDAVKLESLWPRASTPLWYVSQRLVLEAGHAAYDAAIQQVLAARGSVSPTR